MGSVVSGVEVSSVTRFILGDIILMSLKEVIADDMVKKPVFTLRYHTYTMVSDEPAPAAMDITCVRNLFFRPEAHQAAQLNSEGILTSGCVQQRLSVANGWRVSVSEITSLT